MSYPSFIGFGYTSCTNCHFNPLGNGPLTDYGRALSATTVSARPPWITSADVRAQGADAIDEGLGQNSRFLGPLGDLPDWLRLSADYRGLYLMSGIESQTIKRYIPMQAEGNAVILLSEDIFFSGTFGYVPVPQTTSQTQRGAVSTYISREHYLGLRFSDHFGLYTGFMDHAFGVRVPDHNAYIRSRTLLNINDQTHGVMAHFSGKSWEGALHGVAGNLSQTGPIQQRGFSAMFEADAVEKLRLGASVLSTKSDFRSRQLAALHARIGMAEGSSILAQFTAIKSKPLGDIERTGDAVFVQSMSRLARGVYLLMTFEHTTEDLARAATRFYRVGPSIQYFPLQRVELRVDFLSTRSIGGSTINPDTYTLQSQFHIWL